MASVSSVYTSVRGFGRRLGEPHLGIPDRFDDPVDLVFPSLAKQVIAFEGRDDVGAAVNLPDCFDHLGVEVDAYITSSLVKMAIARRSRLTRAYSAACRYNL